MSGHSKWSTIKRKKGAADAKRGRMFTRLIKEITVAARMGGGDPEGNPRLRTAIDTAKAQNMPKDNIERAVKKGTGELEGVNYEEIVYEGYGPAGIGFVVECLTDNKNRAAADIRHIFTKRGGSLAKSGAVSYQFEQKGIISIDKEGVNEDALMEVALEGGAEDVKDTGDSWEVYTVPSDFSAVLATIREAGFAVESAEVTLQANPLVEISDAKVAGQAMALSEALDECEDVQNVYSNFDIPEEILAQLED